jgi:putative copper resistance protein D
MLTVFATLPFHAFLGVTIMTMNGLIAQDWYLGLFRAWPPTPEEDQRIAGGILWGSGDVIALVIFAVLFAQWVRQSQAEARREDRRLDREEAALARERDEAARARGQAAGVRQEAAQDSSEESPTRPA